MPLARMAMYGKGVELYLAPTADQRDSWQATLRHIACEGRCFVLGCNQFVTKDMYPQDLPGIEDLDGPAADSFSRRQRDHLALGRGVGRSACTIRKASYMPSLIWLKLAAASWILMLLAIMPGLMCFN